MTPPIEYRNQQLEQAAVELAGAVWRLSEKGFIGTFDDYDEAECAHLKEIADQSVDKIRKLTTKGGGSHAERLRSANPNPDKN